MSSTTPPTRMPVAVPAAYTPPRLVDFDAGALKRADVK
jgi:hypothetical protein